MRLKQAAYIIGSLGGRPPKLHKHKETLRLYPYRGAGILLATSDLPDPPFGYSYLLGLDGAYLLGADGAYLLGIGQ